MTSIIPKPQPTVAPEESTFSWNASKYIMRDDNYRRYHH